MEEKTYTIEDTFTITRKEDSISIATDCGWSMTVSTEIPMGKSLAIWLDDFEESKDAIQFLLYFMCSSCTCVGDGEFYGNVMKETVKLLARMDERKRKGIATRQDANMIFNIATGLKK